MISLSSEKKVLDDFLPDDNLLCLQQLSRELELETYPKTGILDIYYGLHTKQRSLFDELKMNKEKVENKEEEEE